MDMKDRFAIRIFLRDNKIAVIKTLTAAYEEMKNRDKNERMEICLITPLWRIEAKGPYKSDEKSPTMPEWYQLAHIVGGPRKWQEDETPEQRAIGLYSALLAQSMH